MDIIDSDIESLLKQSYRDAPGQYECLLLSIEKYLGSGLACAKTRESLDGLRQRIQLKKEAAAEPLFPGASASAYLTS
jgi:hypothetical protein